MHNVDKHCRYTFSHQHRTVGPDQRGMAIGQRLSEGPSEFQRVDVRWVWMDRNAGIPARSVVLDRCQFDAFDQREQGSSVGMDVGDGNIWWPAGGEL